MQDVYVPRNRVVYTDPGGRGWAPVELMARLLAHTLDAEYVSLRTRPRADRVRRTAGQLPPARLRGGTCIVIAPQPAHLGSLLTPRYLMGGYTSVVEEAVDDRIPRMAKGRGHFDHLFVTDRELVDTWAEQTGTTTSWLPFGSNVLDQPEMPAERPVDLLRIGRQPPEWDKNDTTQDAAAARGLTFAMAPPLHDDPAFNQARVQSSMRGAKFTLSFTNLVSPADYTHASRDYVTGRWTEALASGAAVAGVPPRCEAGQRVLFDDGLVRLPGTDLGAGLDVVAEAAAAWTPSRADRVHLQALQTLDWRLRFAELAKTIDLSIPRLDDELSRLQARASTLASRSP